jgi:hypothetical protein
LSDHHWNLLGVYIPPSGRRWWWNDEVLNRGNSISWFALSLFFIGRP